MIIYKKYQLRSGLKSAQGKWYIRPVIHETLGIKELAKHMSEHNTPYSPGVIKGVLTDMVSCIRELVLDGKNVKLENLAIFSCGIIPDHGANTPDEFKVSTHVKGVRLRARATGVFSNKSLNLEATLREQGEYSVGVDTGKKPGKDTGKTDVQGGDAGHVKPGEVKPGEVKPGEVKPGEVKPGEQKPGGSILG